MELLLREDLRRKFPKLVSDHVFGDGHVVVDFPIMDLEFEADEVWEDCGCPSHCFNRFDGFAGLGTDYREAVK